MSCSKGHKGKLIPTGLGLRDLIKKKGMVKSLPELTTLYMFEQALELREKARGKPFSSKSELEDYFNGNTVLVATVAYLFGKGHTVDEYESYISSLSEGYDSGHVINHLAQKLGLEG